MPDLTLDLDIRNVDNAVIVDPLIQIRLAHPSNASGQMWNQRLDGSAKAVRLKDAPAGDPLFLRLTPSRYRDIGMFAKVRDGVLIPDARLMKTPRTPSEWLPDFTPWSKLGKAFDLLKQRLRASERFELGRKSGSGKLIEGDYDAIIYTNKAGARAKMSMLNLYARLAVETPPGRTEPWFAHTVHLLQASSERLLCTATSDLATMVRSLSQREGGGYHKADPVLHRGNFESLPGVSGVTNMASIKTDAVKANLQLTVCDAILDDQAVTLVDLDIDEHGKLIPHTFDLVRHWFTDGTDPIDIHEALRELFPKTALGYDLIARKPVGKVSVRVLGT